MSNINTESAAGVPCVYELFRQEGDRATYVAPDNTDLHKSTLVVQSVAPKRNGDSYGNRRTTLNLLEAQSVVDAANVTVTRDLKVALTTSIPVGVTLAEMKEQCYKLSVLLQDASFVENVIMNGRLTIVQA